jgi:hypothetical protein
MREKKNSNSGEREKRIDGERENEEERKDQGDEGKQYGGKMSE